MAATTAVPAVPPRVINLSGVKRTSLSSTPTTSATATSASGPTPVLAQAPAPAVVPQKVVRVGPGLAVLALKQVTDFRSVKAPVVSRRTIPAPQPSVEEEEEEEDEEEDDDEYYDEEEEERM